MLNPQATQAHQGPTSAVTTHPNPGPHSVSMTSGHQPQCVYHMKGRCVRGTTCKFSHAPDTPRDSPSVHGAICEFYKRGCCRFGDQCRLYHPPLASQAIPAPHPPLQVTSPPASNHFNSHSPTLPSLTSMPCKFYDQGRCTKGTACSFSHITKQTPDFCRTSSKIQSKEESIGGVGRTGE